MSSSFYCKPFRINCSTGLCFDSVFGISSKFSRTQNNSDLWSLKTSWRSNSVEAGQTFRSIWEEHDTQSQHLLNTIDVWWSEYQANTKTIKDCKEVEWRQIWGTGFSTTLLRTGFLSFFFNSLHENQTDSNRPERTHLLLQKVIKTLRATTKCQKLKQRLIAFSLNSDLHLLTRCPNHDLLWRYCLPMCQEKFLQSLPFLL